MGYPHYHWIHRTEQARRVLPGPVRNAISTIAAHLLPMGLRGRNHLIGLAGEVSQSIAHVNLFFDLEARRRLLAPLLSRGVCFGVSPEQYKANFCVSGQSSLQQATRADFRAYLVDDILVKVDRASMLTSLEVRAPWLDPRIIEMAFGCVQDSMRAVGSERKILPRALASRVLPPALDLKRKQGFGIPFDEWFRGDWGGFIESLLAKGDEQIFDRGVIRSLVAGQRQGYANSQRLFALAMFELWRREYRVALSD